jgi:hypothetical protein
MTMPTYDELLREVRELRAQAAIDVDRINKLATALDLANATIKERDVEVKRLVDELERVVTKVFGEILSDLKKYEKSVLPTSCAQACLRF